MLGLFARGVSVLALSASLLPAAPPESQNPEPPPSTTEPALAGPRVDRRGSERSLVQRDFDGRLKRLETHPVPAALDLIDLTPEQRAAAMKPLTERSLAIERVMRDNLKLVLEAQAAFKPGDDGRGQQAVVKLYQLAQPIFAQGKPLDLAAAALPPEKARELRRVVNEYMQAAVADRMDGRVDGKKADRLGAFIAESAALFGKEVEAAAKRTFEGGEKEFGELARRLGLTPEQESRMQALFIDMMTRGYDKPSKQQQLKTILNAYKLLTDEQKARLREIMAEEARQAAKARRAMRGEPQPAETPR